MLKNFPLDLTPRQKGLAAGAATAVAVVGLSAARKRVAAGAARRAGAQRDAAATAARAALAASLADAKRHTLLTFQSRDCELCDSLRGPLQEVADNESTWLDVVTIDADNGEAWALETLHYDVTNVPTFVMLDDRGAARARAGRPADADAAVAAVGHMVGVARPKRAKK